MDNLIINFAPTGIIPTRAMTPHVPLRIEEIVLQVSQAYELGITMAHLHVRSLYGIGKIEKALYGEVIHGIREFAPDLILCVSTTGRYHPDLEERAPVLDLNGAGKPDMASLTLSSLNFNKQASINDPDTIMKLAERMRDRGILPELEVFDTGMVNYAMYLEKKKLIRSPHYFNLILGNVACAQANLLHAGVLVQDLPQDSTWSIGGVGDYQLQANTMAIAMGGGVRVGLEDNIWFDQGRTKLATNIELLYRVRGIAKLYGRDVMKPGELRERLGLKPGNGEYGIS
jgi:uncharacterized protein (DUF849 family)